MPFMGACCLIGHPPRLPCPPSPPFRAFSGPAGETVMARYSPNDPATVSPRHFAQSGRRKAAKVAKGREGPRGNLYQGSSIYYEQHLPLIHRLKRQSAAPRNAGKRIFGDADRQPRFFHKQSVEIA